MSYYTLSPEEQCTFNLIDSEFNSFISKVKSTMIGKNAIIIDVDFLRKAYEIARYWHRDTKRKSGELYLYHPLEVCKKMFTDGFVDKDALAAALLHDTVEDTGYTPEMIEKDFNSNVRVCVEIVTKLEASEDSLDGVTKKQAQILTDEHYIEVGRKHPLALYIKFADRYHNLHTCGQMSEKSIKKNVTHTRSILIPLARRVGCNLIADQLEDACMLAMYPDDYKNIRCQLKAFATSSQKHISRTLHDIAAHCEGKAIVDTDFTLPYPSVVFEEIKRDHINHHINMGRRDLFSFYRYKPYAEAFFLLPEATNEPLCSQFLHIVNNLLTRGKFTITSESEADGIAYIDILDTYNNKIRFTVCSVDKYRSFFNGITDRKIEKLYSGSLLPCDKRIRILTRNGDPFDIEKDSTVLDFAFILNTNIGAYYVGAEVNEKAVDMDYVPQQGDQVTILKGDNPTARVSWFRILKTSTATNRLIAFLENT